MKPLNHAVVDRLWLGCDATRPPRAPDAAGDRGRVGARHAADLRQLGRAPAGRPSERESRRDLDEWQVERRAVQAREGLDVLGARAAADAALPCSADPSRQCTYDVFGADGKRASTLKQEFHGCRALCQAAHGQVAETRTAEQRSYLAQVLRQSGDVAMCSASGDRADDMGPRHPGWTWMVSGANISKADEPSLARARRAIASACGPTRRGMSPRAAATPTRCRSARARWR